MSKAAAAAEYDVSRASVYNWLQRAKQGGMAGLEAQRRGPRSRLSLTSDDEAAIRRIIDDQCPDQLQIPGALWTREAVRTMVKRRCGVDLSIWTVGRYLRDWGLSPVRLASRAYWQTRREWKRWRKRRYSRIRASARAGRAEILWCHETPLRPLQRNAGKGRNGVAKQAERHLVAAVTNRRRYYFMVCHEKLSSATFLSFIGRLVEQVGRKMLLIVDKHRTHRSAAVEKWLSEHADQVRLVRLHWEVPRLKPGEESRASDLALRRKRRQWDRNVKEKWRKVRMLQQKAEARAKGIAGD